MNSLTNNDNGAVRYKTIVVTTYFELGSLGRLGKAGWLAKWSMDRKSILPVLCRFSSKRLAGLLCYHLGAFYGPILRNDRKTYDFTVHAPSLMRAAALRASNDMFILDSSTPLRMTNQRLFCFGHLILAFRACFGFRYSDLGFVR